MMEIAIIAAFCIAGFWALGIYTRLWCEHARPAPPPLKISFKAPIDGSAPNERLK